MGQLRSVTDEEKQERREKILEAAKRLFLRFGYSKTNMDEIAEEAYISTGTIYLYFQNKEDLFAELIAQEARGMQRFLAKSLVDETSVAKQMEIIFYKTLEYLGRNPFLESILRGDLEVISPRNLKYVTAIEKKYVSAIEQYVQVGIDKGEIYPFDQHVIAYTLYEIFKAFSLIATVESEELDREDIMAFVAHLVEKMMAGLCRSPESGKKAEVRQLKR